MRPSLINCYWGESDHNNGEALGVGVCVFRKDHRILDGINCSDTSDFILTQKRLVTSTHVASGTILCVTQKKTNFPLTVFLIVRNARNQ